MPSTLAPLCLSILLQAVTVLSLTTLTGLGQSDPAASTPQSAIWHDPSPHSVRMVRVDQGVDLEVLDWGGVGRSVVLLTGAGNTAHVFDEFAPKLTSAYHVYGITRRGFGLSSAPSTGYAADRLGDDVLAVLQALNLSRPVLVGHSIAGEELSSIATRYPDRIAGAIYLDAALSFAYYDPSVGDMNLDRIDLQKKLNQLAREPREPRPLVQDLLQTDLPRFERDLQRFQRQFEAMLDSRQSYQDPTAADRASVPAFRSWQTRVDHLAFPEAELRQQFEVNPDGSVGASKARPFVREEIAAGQQRYSHLRGPILAIFAIDNGHDVTAQIAAFERGNPSAPVIRIAHANHYVYLSNEAEVIREIKKFMQSLP